MYQCVAQKSKHRVLSGNFLSMIFYQCDAKNLSNTKSLLSINAKQRYGMYTTTK